jgi:hypothetical protein
MVDTKLEQRVEKYLKRCFLKMIYDSELLSEAILIALI